MLIPILTFIAGVVFGVIGKVMYDKNSSDVKTPDNIGEGFDHGEERTK